jgi:hypothetical protein
MRSFVGLRRFSRVVRGVRRPGLELESLERRDLMTAASVHHRAVHARAAVPADVAPITAAPTVTALQLYGKGAQPSRLVVTFSTPMDPTSVQNIANYSVTGPLGVHGRGGSIGVYAATYKPSTNQVLLSLDTHINLHSQYRFTITGSGDGAVTSATGVPLDGTNSGQPGSDFELTGIGGRIYSGPFVFPPDVS